ncbi:MAG: biotin/lipoyl-containing protein, partial [Oscillospiraceae bacterium]|nr:biotin/lipoyl-containing protein [Oscillospiraceae bacterium]
PAAKAAAAPVSGTKVAAPMPGNILEVCVNVGDAVTAGQKLVVLEAMKMENDITAPADGTVGQVAVAKGDTVSTGDLLVDLLTVKA